MASPIPVTLLYGGLNAVLTVALGLNTSRVRGHHKQYVGDALNAEVTRASRAHGNNAEWVPLGILLLLLAELAAGGSLWLHLVGGTLLLARVCHAIGVLAKNPLSVLGATLTYLTVGGTAVWLVVMRFLHG